MVVLAMTWVSSNEVSIRCGWIAIRTPNDSKMIIKRSRNHKLPYDFPGNGSGLPRLEVAGFSEVGDITSLRSETLIMANITT
jgi:hypothetical protein